MYVCNMKQHKRRSDARLWPESCHYRYSLGWLDQHQAARSINPCFPLLPSTSVYITTDTYTYALTHIHLKTFNPDYTVFLVLVEKHYTNICCFKNGSLAKVASQAVQHAPPLSTFIPRRWARQNTTLFPTKQINKTEKNKDQARRRACPHVSSFLSQSLKVTSQHVSLHAYLTYPVYNCRQAIMGSPRHPCMYYSLKSSSSLPRCLRRSILLHRQILHAKARYLRQKPTKSVGDEPAWQSIHPSSLLTTANPKAPPRMRRRRDGHT